MIKQLEIPNFNDKQELFRFLVENKSTLISQKKAVMKKADGISFNNTLFDHSGAVINKSNNPVSLDIDPLMVMPVINSTNVIDSHLDLHLPGMWNRSLKNNGKNLMHIQEHEMGKFSYIISDGADLKAMTETLSWKELGYNFKGKTEALIFHSKVRKKRNPYMHEQYASGYVKNHSVGMFYVQLIMCINDKDFGAEYEAYQKYIEMAENPEVAEESGYFWAVPEARAIEGSAVPKGSNMYTPTLSNNMESEKETIEPEKKGVDYGYLAANFKIV